MTTTFNSPLYCRFADLNVAVDNPSSDFTHFAAKYLVPKFSDPHIIVTVTSDDIEKEREISRKELELEGYSAYDFPRGEYEKTAIYRKIAEELPLHNAFVFHACAIAVEQDCYLFTAKSGTGKTTHSQLWLENIPNSYIVNGDKPIVRITEEGIFAYGTPWAGKEGWQTATKARVCGISLLERGEDNSISAVSYGEAFPLLLQQTYRPRNEVAMLQTLSLLDTLGSTVPLNRLFCTISKEAALLSYSHMAHSKCL